jgi:hypothetical protein
VSLTFRYKLFWATCVSFPFGLAYWRNPKSYPVMKWYKRLIKAGIDTALVILMVVYAPGLANYARGDVADESI